MTSKSIDAGSAQAGYVSYNISVALQAFDELNSGISQKTCAPAGLRQRLESFAPLHGIVYPQKALQEGYAMASKRDEKCQASFVWSSRCGVETV